ncbi:serine-rich adhesin for platelets isoform X2 [Eurosta solidaginis]|uniref:serine-rich adhesin for platelets isoform X2 n=1 Tax=Eurosta solidaginis TaxID=178769 RepID=UPI003530B6C4
MELRDDTNNSYEGTTSFYYALLLTLNVTLMAVVLMASCLWCRRQAQKDELGGLEGMVKMTNPDEVVVVKLIPNSESNPDLNVSAVSNTDSEKRASTAAHRSLPDIPVGDANGDNGSELYETVADKRVLGEGNDHNKSPSPSIKKQTSVSQHSSISQADDVSSPYSRVRNPPHDYAKVRNTEHPYAQVNPPTTSAAAAAAAVVAAGNSSNVIHSNQPPLINGTISRNLNHSDSSQNSNDVPVQAEIPAASAIAGMISASQDLPYMTPPITSQHFSGDSQDSSSYTSISVREPLANILAQQPPKPTQRLAALTRDGNDSHYATVSDDSDETYAAIEDPNMRNNPNVLTDIYTSGSETYAQIQPMNSMVVSVEINNSSSHENANNAHGYNEPVAQYNIANTAASTFQHVAYSNNAQVTRPISENGTPIPPPVDSLRTQKHSRQASSSSNNSSSICNLGSPKPEKRQANSPLPPTPKSNITSGRSSVISVIECAGPAGELNLSGVVASVTNTIIPTINAASSKTVDVTPQKNKSKSLSPSKDIEGMYAKVMKKNKFSRHSPSSQNNSPVMTRKYVDNATVALGVSPLDIAAAELMETHRASVFTMPNIHGDKTRMRSNSYGSKDHGYETIPADGLHRSAAGPENRKSDCYSSLLQKVHPKEILQISNPPAANAKPPIILDPNSDKHYETIAMPLDTTSSSDHGYETLQKPNKLNQSDPENEKKLSDYDPNYEVIEGPKSAGLSDDGYAKINETKHLTVGDDTDGYSKVKGEENEDCATGGYSTIAADANHNYASIAETKQELLCGATPDTEDCSDHYARIGEGARIPQSASELPLGGSTKLLTTPSGKLTQSLSVNSGSGTLDTLAVTSPSSINSSSLLTTSSTLFSPNTLTGSSSSTTTNTSTMSSRHTPSTSTSQYESLTGSETDPNYESVCYSTNTVGQANQYERLQTDYSVDTQPSSSSPITPDELKQQLHKHNVTNTHNTTTKARASSSSASPEATTTATNSENTAATVLLKANTTANGVMPKVTAAQPTEGSINKVQNTSELNATDVVVDDYFQV